MQIHRLASLCISLLILTACNSKPGDAARRGGHLAQAADLYRKGADQGDAAAAFKLGQMAEG